MLSSESNKFLAKVFASSVLPTPVGPKKINEPIGLFISFNPALALSIAEVTDVIASSCPITLFCISSSSLNNFSLSPSNKLDTGIPVHLDKTCETSSSVTSSFNKAPS